MKCGKPSKKKIDINRLSALGAILDRNQQLSVFDQGFVGLTSESESEVMQYAAVKPWRSAARPRAGQRAAEGSWRSTGQADRRCSDALKASFGAEFRILAQHYAALAFEDSFGLWVAVTSMPLGLSGPQIHFLVAFPLDEELAPKGWAFEKVGPNARLMSLKHTNFPDASICAFLPREQGWKREEGMTSLVDIYTVWAVKKLHCDHLGTWPGAQAGVCSFYRRREFHANEWCGCQSGKRYRDCHRASDMLVNEVVAKAEFERMFHSNYFDRTAPQSILNAAKSKWRSMPSMRWLHFS